MSDDFVWPAPNTTVYKRATSTPYTVVSSAPDVVMIERAFGAAQSIGRRNFNRDYTDRPSSSMGGRAR